MNPTRCIAIALALAFCKMQALAQEPARPLLRAQAVVTGDVVKIGDLVENAGIIAKVPIFRAPDLGATGKVPAEAVVAAVQQHALIGLDTAGLTEVTVTRAARTIPAKDIEDAVAQALAEQYRLGPASDISVRFDGVLTAVHVEPSALGDPRVARIAYDVRSGRFDVTLELPTGSATHGDLRLTGRAIPTLAVLTVARAVERGGVLKDADVVVERRPRAEVGREALTEPDRALGLAARANLPVGHILRSADLAKPEVVQRNEPVTLTYAMPGITLTVRGKAMQAGAEGDVISVMNEQSKRTLQGVVAGPGLVSMTGGSPRFAANTISTAR